MYESDNLSKWLLTPLGPDDFLLSSLDIYLPSSVMELYWERQTDRDTRETKTERDRQRHWQRETETHIQTREMGGGGGGKRKLKLEVELENFILQGLQFRFSQNS